MSDTPTVISVDDDGVLAGELRAASLIFMGFN
jgi:hypothetical protein